MASVWCELSRLGFRWPTTGEASTFRAVEFGAGPAAGSAGILAGEAHAPVGLPADGNFALIEQDRWLSRFDEVQPSPNQLRWSPLPAPTTRTDFVDGLYSMAGNGDAASMNGCASLIDRARPPSGLSWSFLEGPSDIPRLFGAAP